MTTVRIAGVPEHFNLPWHLAMESGEFAAQDLDVQWTDVPEGTGRLCQMLREGQADIAVLLTEGIVRDIVLGNPSKIVQVYVQSPLLWGIHVAADSAYKSVDEVKGKIGAISRPGSGSQLMAYVLASSMGWPTDDLKFEVVQTIDGAVKSLTAGQADYFMWERFMTKPLVDSGVFRRLDDCPTPWPCFVIAASDEFIAKNPDALRNLLEVINKRTSTVKEIEGINEMISTRYGLKPEDVNQWLSLTEWSQKVPDVNMLNEVQNQLLSLSLIPKLGTFVEIAKAP
jgi:ABC-type nitrate/sulfonate/bicarbonate transport system substrate-binding protein